MVRYTYAFIILLLSTHYFVCRFNFVFICFVGQNTPRFLHLDSIRTFISRFLYRYFFPPMLILGFSGYKEKKTTTDITYDLTQFTESWSDFSLQRFISYINLILSYTFLISYRGYFHGHEV